MLSKKDAELLQTSQTLKHLNKKVMTEIRRKKRKIEENPKSEAGGDAKQVYFFFVPYSY